MNCKICGHPTKKRNGVPNSTCSTTCRLMWIAKLWGKKPPLKGNV